MIYYYLDINNQEIIKSTDYALPGKLFKKLGTQTSDLIKFTNRLLKENDQLKFQLRQKELS